MISHFFSWQKFPDSMWPYFAAEFHDNDACCQVLTHHWALRLLAEPEFSGKLSAFLRSSELCLMGSHAPFGTDWDLHSITDKCLKEHHELLYRCADFGIDTYTMHVGIFPENIPSADVRLRSLHALEELVSTAAKLKITIALENAEHPGGSVSELRFYREKLACPAIGFCYDSGHANLNGGVLAVLDGLRSDVVVCHLHDNDGVTDWHWAPGCGNVPWAQLTPLLHGAPRLGSWQNEVNILDNGISLSRICRIFSALESKGKGICRTGIHLKSQAENKAGNGPKTRRTE